MTSSDISTTSSCSSKLSKVAGKRVRDIFYTEDEKDDKVLVCSCGKKRRQTRTGYSYLISHDRGCHLKELEASLDTSLQPKDKEAKVFLSLWNKNTVKVHGWVKYIIDNLRPFDFCENPKVIEHVKYDKLSYKTFIRYTEKLVKRVEKKKIKGNLPNRFSNMFDGWSEGGTYFVAIYAFYPAWGPLRYNASLLSFSPLEKEADHFASEHEELLRYVLNIFGMILSNVIAIIGDNCENNKLLAKNLPIPFVGCESHRYNLAMSDIIEENRNLIDSIKTIMSKLCFSLRRAKLHEFADYAPVKCNDTIWSSVHDMLSRYVFIRDHLPKLNIFDLDELLLDRKEDQEADKVLETMKKLNSITLKLQRDDATISQVRCYFDAVIDFNPALSSLLDSASAIVENSTFESALVKIQLEKKLTDDEKIAVKSLEVGTEVLSESDDDPDSLADAAMKHFRKSQLSMNSKYLDVRFICPSSNRCGWLFSAAKRALCDLRKSISPYHMECIMFLYANCELWGISDINVIVD